MNSNPEARSRHHLLFPRTEWELRPQAMRIRRTPSMIVPMTRGEHDYMHDVVPLVPLLGHSTLWGINELWARRNNTLQDIDSLCVAIDKASKPHRVHQLERDLGGLTIEALMMEKAVLKETGVWVA